MPDPKKILVAPLDWGLGHATRCMPIINLLLELGHEPILATDGRAYDLLQSEYPKLRLLRLDGYHPEYPEDGNMVWSMGLQLPRFLAAIASEHTTVNEWVGQYQLDGIISDNRYGCYTSKVPTVFITHQVNILMPEWADFMTSIVAKLNHFFLRQFDRCWIPDLPHEHNLAGSLSRPPKNEGLYRHIGLLSRLKAMPEVPEQYDLLVLLSGPEPQRTLLEKTILSQLEMLDLNTFVVQGITEKKELVTINPKLEICSYLAAEELALAMASSKMVVARSGYSTVMDLAPDLARNARTVASSPL